MAETPYPYYQLNAEGPSETGFSLTIQIQAGAGGPIAGATVASVVDAVRDYLAGLPTTTTTRLSRAEVVTTNEI